jgi:hypothetical protein
VRIVPEARCRTMQPVFYVGSLLRPRDQDCWEIKFMRRRGTINGKFTFPSTDDICSYPLSSIVTVLSQPKVDHRNVHHFADDFSAYHGSLR